MNLKKSIDYQAIIKTLAYADIFDYPLTLEEIHRYLIGYNTSIQSLNKSVTLSNLKQYRGYYYLPGRKKIVSNRLKRARTSIEKIIYAKSLSSKLRVIPSIRAIYITGALAMNNSETDDDIDLMIITSPNTLWITRLMVNSVLDTFNLRRKPIYPQPISFTNKICLNLWLDQSALTISKTNRNLYVAHEVAQALPIFDRLGVHQQFLYQNRWIKKYLPNFPNPKKPKITIKQFNNSTISLYLETLAYRFQIRIMSSKKTREKISPHSAFFHPRDTGSWVMREYKKRVKSLNSKS